MRSANNASTVHRFVCGARDRQNVQRAQPSNPLVGPIYIEGAEPTSDAIAKRWLPAAP
jgi:hypothetical protein